MENTNISVQTVPYRFSKAMCDRYAVHIREGFAADKKVVIFAGPEERAKLMLTLPGSVTKEEMAKITIFPYPCNPRAANNVARGMTNTNVIFIDNIGRYTHILKPAVSALKNVNALFIDAEQNITV